MAQVQSSSFQNNPPAMVFRSQEEGITPDAALMISDQNQAKTDSVTANDGNGDSNIGKNQFSIAENSRYQQ